MPLRFFRLPHLAALALLYPWLVPAPALASGGVSCNGKSVAAEITASAGVEHGWGAAVSDPAAQITLNDKEVPEDLRATPLALTLVHHWIFGDDVKLHFIREGLQGKAVRVVEAVIETRNVPDAAELRGTFTIHVFDMDPPHDAEGGRVLEFKGEASCLME
ncbi:MAG: hypothetical protein KGO53_00445 [Alphaproteobacteria bacterium]|nr:hypothetical protein [Alphaproteobacteria bacterium]